MALLKTVIAERVRGRAAREDSSSTSRPAPGRRSAATTGTGFSPSCKYTLGVEGGASVHDPDGAFHEASLRYLAEHPEASFEEVEANCFPGVDGGIAYYAISPRHLEACATRTAQVLIEGSYNGILRPGEHYLELRRDFSNLDEVLDRSTTTAERARITETRTATWCASGAYTYERFVRDVEAVALAGAARCARRGG